jgi:hypothetical protein
MFIVLTQPRFRHRQPVAGVIPNDSRNLSNNTIGLAAANAHAISPGFLPMVLGTRRGLALVFYDPSIFFLLFFSSAKHRLVLPPQESVSEATKRSSKDNSRRGADETQTEIGPAIALAVGPFFP